MGRRGRRQVLQLDTVSTSHQSRRYGFQPQEASNPLLNLVGQYNSDSEEEDEQEDTQDSPVRHLDSELAGAPVPKPNHPGDNSSVEKMSDSKTVVHGASNSKTAVDEAFDSGTAKDGSLDSQVASFLAEIESISTEPSQTQENGHTDHSDVQTTHTHNSDLGFIIKPDATSVSSDKSDHRVRSTTGSAYRSMFVKGESEFVRSDDGGDNDRDGNVLNPDEELPKEPVSEWQMVQDEATQYYYYWNTVTNEVTWEIPPDYTQFLLLYKEYEERLAKIPQDKLRRLQQKAEIKKQMKESQKSASSTSGSSESITSLHTPCSQPKSSKTSEPVTVCEPTVTLDATLEKEVEHVQHGPLLPASGSQSMQTARESVKQVDVGSRTLSVTSSLPADTDRQPESMSLSVAAPHPTVSADVIISEVLMSSGSAATTTLVPETKGDKLQGSVEAGNLPPQSVTETPEPVDRVEPVDRIEPADRVEPEENVDDDDLDMDFDDIDDLDRALEKALEKKLEKKKAELLKLDGEKPGTTVDQPSCPQPTDEKLSTVSLKPDRENTTTVSHKSDTENTTVGHTSDTENTTVSHKSDTENTRTHLEQQVRQVSPAVVPQVTQRETDENRVTLPTTTKRSAAGTECVEPVEKKARLVAYDAVESDDEGGDALPTTSRMASQPDNMATMTAEGDFSSVLPTPPPERVDNLAELQNMADTALDKLAFLEVTTKGLTPLQITLVQLQTRLRDWQDGGLNAEYFFQRMSEVNGLLEQYESAAVPPGWACHWDRNFRRYFYTHQLTGESQWDYPHNNGQTGSPQHHAGSPQHHAGSPQHHAGSPQHHAGSPQHHAGSPQHHAGSPQHHVTLSTSRTKKNKGTKKGGKGKVKVISEDTKTETCGKEDKCVAMVSEELDGVAMAMQGVHPFQKQGREEEGGKSSPPATASDVGELSSAQSAYHTLFPGEPLPPGTELLFGLPPPPPPPIPPPESSTLPEDNYVCDDDSSNENAGEEVSERVERRGEGSQDTKTVEDVRVSQGVDGVVGCEQEKDDQQATVDPGVIAKPPQLRLTAAACVLGATRAPGNTAVESSSSSSSISSVLTAPPVLSTFSHQQAGSVSSVACDANVDDSTHSMLASPKPEDSVHSGGSPSQSVELVAPGEHRHEKHKKKRKEKLGNSGLSLKKKGVSSLVQKWQKVKREVEQEERANEQRQMAIRQQLEEWKKENT